MGAGRPSKLTEPVNLVLRVEKAVLREAKLAALEKGKSLSEIVRLTLERLVGDRRKRSRRGKGGQG